MDQQSAKEYGEKIAEALTHIENNKNLAQTDLKEGDGYETLEYLENMGVWIRDAREQLAVLLGKLAGA
jgi:hypothetical protein